MPVAWTEGSCSRIGCHVNVTEGEVEKLLQAFQACDADNSNEIDKEELRAVMKTLGENVSDKALNVCGLGSPGGFAPRS